jgi:hypothetical protein
VNLRDNCWLLGTIMAAERPQGGLELEFTWRRPSGITQLKGIRLLYSYYNFNRKTSLQTSVADPCFWASRFRIRIH